jgi:hypothetical protein
MFSSSNILEFVLVSSFMHNLLGHFACGKFLRIDGVYIPKREICMHAYLHFPLVGVSS